jgi:hypothetical protein
VSFDPTTSILAGMDTAVLQARLQQMQLDYLDLSSGRKVETASYSMGDGQKSVTYTKANLADLAQAIRLLQSQLGIVCRGRRAFRPVF